MKKFRNKRDKQVYIVKATAVLLVLFIIAVIADRNIRPNVEQVASYQAKIYATETVNTAVYNELAHTDYTYANFVNLSMDETGNVTALQTDVVSINRLKTRITNQLIQDFDLLSTQGMSIPAGSLTGSQLLSGRGPKIPFRIVYTGNMEIDFTDVFENVGINQTKHQIILTIQMEVSAVLPGTSVTVTVPSTFYIADTVIVGKVPDSFTEVVGDNQDLIPQINDYGNN